MGILDQKVVPPVEVKMDLDGGQQTAFVVAGRVPESPSVKAQAPRMTDRELGGEPDPEAEFIGMVLFDPPELEPLREALSERGGPPESKEARLAALEQRRSVLAEEKAEAGKACDELLKLLGLSAEVEYPPLLPHYLMTAAMHSEVQESFFHRLVTEVSSGLMGAVLSAEHDATLEVFWTNRALVQERLEALHKRFHEISIPGDIEL